VKELYYYLDATPTNSYLKMLYKYPQAAFPYSQVVGENRRRAKDREFELIDTGVFNDDRYFDVFVEYAKVDAEDIIIKITAHIAGRKRRCCMWCRNLWFRNTWSWEKAPSAQKPLLSAIDATTVRAEHPLLGNATLYAEPAGGMLPKLLFTENETNVRRLWNQQATGHFKDAFHEPLWRATRKP